MDANGFATLSGRQGTIEWASETEFERAFRIHQNTVEQMVIFLPSLWRFGYYVHPLTGAGLGLVFVISRLIYRKTYLNDPTSRKAGFGIGALAMIVL